MATRTGDRRTPAAGSVGTAHDPAGGQIRLDSLTALRWIAAVWVFLYHARFLTAHNGLRHIQDVFIPGKAAVSMFYILSGFVLAWVARSSDTKARFYRRRFARIYPLYLTAFLMGLGVTFYVEGGINAWHALAAGTLTQTWFPDMSIFFAINGPGWSLSVESFFYLCFPFLLPVLMRMTGQQRRALLAGCAAFVIGWEGFMAWTQMGVGTQTYWFDTVLPLVRLPEFVGGMLLGLEARDGRWPRIPVRTALAATAVGLAGNALVVIYLGMAGFRLATAAVTFLPLLLLVPVLAREDALGHTPRWVTPRLVRWGNRSYAFYLVHQLVTRVYDHARPPTTNTAVAVVALLGMLAVSMLLADLLYRHVERRFERRLRGEPPRGDVRRSEDVPYPDEEPVRTRAAVG